MSSSPNKHPMAATSKILALAPSSMSQGGCQGRSGISTSRVFNPQKVGLELRCGQKPEGSSLAPFYKGILDTPSSLAPFKTPASESWTKTLHETNELPPQKWWFAFDYFPFGEGSFSGASC